MLPADGNATFIWFTVPFSVLYSFALPAAFIPRSWLEDPSSPDANAFHVELKPSKYQKDFKSVSYTSNPFAGDAIANLSDVFIRGARNPRATDLSSRMDDGCGSGIAASLIPTPWAKRSPPPVKNKSMTRNTKIPDTDVFLKEV